MEILEVIILATIKQIAAASGFSSATVSRFLNGDENLSITAKTKEKILESARELGYFNDKKAPVMKRKVAFIFNYSLEEELQNIYFNSLKHNLTGIARKSRIDLKVVDHVSEVVMEDNEYDGFIAIGIFKPEELNELAKSNIPGTFIDTNPLPHLYDSVQPDLRQIIKDALQLLVKNGFKRIGFIGGKRSGQPQSNDIRENVFRAYAKRLGVLDGESVFASGEFTTENGYFLGKEVLKRLGRKLPDAFIVASDNLSVGVLQAFNEGGVLVPRDVKLVSINNSELAKYVSPPLTTYNIDQKELCNLAVETLEGTMQHRYSSRRHSYISADLIVRRSFIPK